MLPGGDCGGGGGGGSAAAAEETCLLLLGGGGGGDGDGGGGGGDAEKVGLPPFAAAGGDTCAEITCLSPYSADSAGGWQLLGNSCCNSAGSKLCSVERPQDLPCGGEGDEVFPKEVAIDSESSMVRG